MPTSGNLRDSPLMDINDPHCSGPNPLITSTIIDPVPNLLHASVENGFIGHYMKPSVRCRPSKSLIYHCNNEIILSVMKSDICNYTPQKPNYKNKIDKSAILSGRFGDLYAGGQGD